MNVPTLWFFGSFGDYSATVLAALSKADRAGKLKLLGVVTTPALPAGRKQELKKTEVQVMAEDLDLPVATPAQLTADTLTEVQAKFGQPDLLVTVGYGKLLPESWLAAPTKAALNLHFSLLPKYRGANPAEWALLANELKTGITLIEMSPEFDTGRIVAQASLSITATDTRETIYTRLYELSTQVLPEMLESYTAQRHAQRAVSETEAIRYFFPPQIQDQSPTPYARRFGRDDGFIEWSAVQAAMAGKETDPHGVSPLLQSILKAFNLKLDAVFIERATRALAGFPGLWTKVQTTKGEKRMKILATSIANGQLQLLQVQIEGQSPAAWNQLKNSLQN